MPNDSAQEDMQRTTKRLIAREGLIFIASLVVGLTIAPITIVVLIGKDVQHSFSMLPSFYEALFSREWAITWLVALGPYIITQLGRSLVWAVKTTKGR